MHDALNTRTVVKESMQWPLALSIRAGELRTCQRQVPLRELSR